MVRFFSVLSVFSAISSLLAGCGGSHAQLSDAELFGPDEGRGLAIKVSYLRYDYRPDPKTRTNRLGHSYFLMMSEGWKNKRGSDANEPFQKIFRDPFYSDSIQDEILIALVRRMEAAGFHELRETPLESIDLDLLRRVEQTQDARTAGRIRVITVETDKFRKTVTYNDNDDARGTEPGPLNTIFWHVQREILLLAPQYTVQVSAGALEKLK
ncbi:MAG: hypothetical protein HY716_09735 [Planctomycetes bacterium]|nr:hypothetical protein [Planctomycetota bacterium]